MRQILLILLIGLLFSFPAQLFSQKKSNGRTDSLEKVIATLIGKGKADALVLLSGEYLNTDAKKGLDRAKEALKISEEEYYNDGIALSYLSIALFEKKTGEFTKTYEKGLEYALKTKDPSVLSRAINITNILFEDKQPEKIPVYFERIKEAAIRLNFNPLLGKIYREIAYYLYSMSDYNGAVTNFKKALSEYKKAKMGSETAGMTMNIGVLYFKSSQLDSSLKFYREARSYFQKTGDLRNEASAITNIAMTLEQMGKAPEALKLLNEALKKYEIAKDSVLLAGAYEIMGTIVENLQDMNSAIKFAFKASQIREAIHDSEHLSLSYNNLSSIYFGMNNYSRSEYYARQGIYLAQKIHNKEVLATCYSNLGMLADKYHHSDSALYFQQIALKLREEMGMEILMAENYNNIADHYFQKKDYRKAEINYKKASELSERNKDFEKLPKYLLGSARCLMVDKKYSEALPLLLKAEKYLLESKRVEIGEVYTCMSSCYGNTGDFRNAYRYLSLTKRMSDSISDLEKGRINAEMLEKYETDKREKEISILTKDKELKSLQNQQQQERLNQQNKFLLIALVGLLLISVFAFFLFRSNRERKKANQIIMAQKAEVEASKHIIEEKQKEIIDSITYARQIQRSLITNEKYIAATLERLKGENKKL